MERVRLIRVMETLAESIGKASLQKNRMLGRRQALRWLGRKATSRLCIVAIVVFGSLNLLAFTGTYFLTHFRAPSQVALGKPRPTNTKLPSEAT